MAIDKCCSPPKQGINPPPLVCGVVLPVYDPFQIVLQQHEVAVIIPVQNAACGCCFIQQWRMGAINDGAIGGISANIGPNIMASILPATTYAIATNGAEIRVTYRCTSGPNGNNLVATMCASYTPPGTVTSFTGFTLFIDCQTGDGTNITTIPGATLLVLPTCFN